MLLLEVVEPVAFDAQVLLFLSVLFCARICERCAWSVVVGPSGDVARPLLRKSERRDACTVMSARGVAMKRPAAGTSAAVSESNLPPGASLPPACASTGIRPRVCGPSPSQVENEEIEAEASRESRTICGEEEEEETSTPV